MSSYCSICGDRLSGHDSYDEWDINICDDCANEDEEDSLNLWDDVYE